MPGLVGGLFGRLIDALLEAGDLQAAEEALGHSGFEEALPAGWQFFPMIQARGRLRIAQGDDQAGIDDLLAGQDVLDRAGIANPAGAPCRSAAAVALARIGRRAEARELLSGELAAARRFGAPGTLGIALRAAGVIEGGSAGIELLHEAAAELERSPARLQHARALADLGAALRRSGRRRDAQQPLRQALDLADRCGGKVVADQARAELVITGARPRRARIAGVDALTPSERRVAQLAAQGMTNREIAQALFVSHPTVVTHLGHCYEAQASAPGPAPAVLDERGSDRPGQSPYGAHDARHLRPEHDRTAMRRRRPALTIKALPSPRPPATRCRVRRGARCRGACARQGRRPSPTDEHAARPDASPLPPNSNTKGAPSMSPLRFLVALLAVAALAAPAAQAQPADHARVHGPGRREGAAPTGPAVPRHHRRGKVAQRGDGSPPGPADLAVEPAADQHSGRDERRRRRRERTHDRPRHPGQPARRPRHHGHRGT